MEKEKVETLEEMRSRVGEGSRADLRYRFDKYQELVNSLIHDDIIIV